MQRECELGKNLINKALDDSGSMSLHCILHFLHLPHLLQQLTIHLKEQYDRDLSKSQSKQDL